MAEQPKPRLLMVYAQASDAVDFQRALGVVGAEGDRSALVPEVLLRLEIETAESDTEALELIRAARRDRRPYDVVMVDLEGPGQTRRLDLVRRLWELDAELPVLLRIDERERPAARRYVTRKLERMDYFTFLPHRLPADELRQTVTLRLKQRMAERASAELQERVCAQVDAIQRAQEEVRNAGLAKDEFLANISHEVRTPMNAILGFSRMLLKEPLSDDQNEKLQYIHDAAESLLQLISNVLDYSKLSSGQMKLGRTPLDIAAILRDVLTSTGQTADHKGLLIDYYVDQSVPRRLLGDKIRVRQVIANLVSNAVKFTEHGEIHIRATLDEADHAAAIVRLTVSDTGIGIPAERQALILESFVQGDGSSTRQHGGLGLGLAICKQVADLMGGQIGFRSHPDSGSSFWVTMPLGRYRRKDGSSDDSGAADADAAPRSGRIGRLASDATDNDTPSKQRAAAPRVLVAEDDHLSRTLVEMLLGRAGCVINAATNGCEAVDAVKQLDYDLVLMDVEMPQMDGLEAIRAIRQFESTSKKHTPIVALTAMVMPGDQQRCLDAGADDYISKPVSPDTLLAAAHRWLPGCLERADGQLQPVQPAAPEPQPDDPDNSDNTATELHQCCRTIEQAMASRDFGRLEQSAGQLKRLSISHGVRPLADQAMRVQFAARSNDAEHVAGAVARLKSVFPEADTLTPEPVGAAT